MKFICVKEARGEKITDAKKAVKLMENEGKIDREAFWVLHLNTQNQVIEKELVSLGIVNCSVVHPREVFKKAIVNSAVAIITVHNHPSGNLQPSVEDEKMWRILNRSGEIIGISVLDNLIITPQGAYYSEKNGRRG